MDAPVKGIQIKCGVYHVENRQISISDMCDRARLAAATIKHQYSTHYALYDDSLLTHALREHQLANCMEEALEQKQFKVFLQPKHNTDSKAVAGAEALVRWNHPELGFISPGEFIPLFERNGFITRLDEYMLREVCEILKSWIADGMRPVPISVNISRADFMLDDLPERISERVDTNATLAVLTEAEHQGNASILNIIGKETEIDRNAFAAIRKQFWMDFAALFV